MATVGDDSPKKKNEPKEIEVDYMADAPKERPYEEAVTDEHRAFLREHGVIIPEPKGK
jgi:hypothetical protein